MLVRVFVHNGSLANSFFWRELARLYLKQLLTTGRDICAGGLGGVGDLRDEESLSGAFPELFLSRGRDKPQINFVIGWGDDYNVHCCDAFKNIILTASRPKAPNVDQVAALAKFDYVLVPTLAEQQIFYYLGLKKPARHLVPTTENLKEFFDEVITSGSTK